MKLFSAPLSLFARKVEIALGEKGIDFERIEVPFTQTEGYEPRNPEVLRINPKRQVPVLVDGDLELYDSTLILEYLEDAYPVPALLPADPKARARCRLWELFADEVMFTSVRPLLYRTGPRPADPTQRAALDAAATATLPEIVQHYDRLDRQLRGRDYLCGALSVADIAAFMVVHWSVRLGGPELGGKSELAAWHARLSRRPAFAAAIDAIGRADRALSYPIDGSPRTPVAHGPS